MKKNKQGLEIEQISLVRNAEKSQLFNDERITFKIPSCVKSQFLRLAGEKCFNVSQVLRSAVNDFIERNK